MKSLFLATALLGIAVIFSNPEIYARQCCGGPGQGWQKYNKTTVETNKGKIVDMGAFERGGIHVSLKTGKETIDVHLGPSSFLNDKIKISKGDAISVTGSRITYNGVAVIIAREIEKGGVRVRLRNDDGTPLWHGQGHRKNAT